MLGFFIEENKFCVVLNFLSFNEILNAWTWKKGILIYLGKFEQFYFKLSVL